MATDNIEEIKSKIDVVELLQEYIQLKPAGANNFRALCPFHHEKTPSFMVSKDKQIWHCFGCGEGGDIFGFVMKMEGLEFPEALRVLAKRAGVQLRYQDPALQNQKTKLQDICREAAYFFHKILLEHPKAASVREYLVQRQVSPESIETWQLGFAPDAWETLNTFLIQKKFKDEDIFLAGLSIKKDKGVGYYDRFRNRLMFPVMDVHGAVVGFGGRWMGKDDDPMAAKYINSPQTMIYDKSRILFGLDKAKTEIKKLKMAVVVEGYMDCLTSHQAGVTNVVASSGTALTNDQVTLLKRYTTNVAFAFDKDSAGENATKRGIDVAMAQDMNIRMIQIPFGKDPDELIKKDPKAWTEAINKSISIMDFYFDNALSKADISKVDDKKIVARVLLGVIDKLADQVEQTHYLQKLSSILGVDESVLREKLGQISKKKSISSPAILTAPELRADRFTSIAESLLGYTMRWPEHLNYISGQLIPDDIPEGKPRDLYKKLITYYTEKQSFDSQDFINALKREEARMATYADVLMMRVDNDSTELDAGMLEQEIITSVKELKRHQLQQSLKIIEQRIRAAERSHDQELIERHTHEFSELMGELKHLE